MPNPTVLHPPPTRALQSWGFFWRVYRHNMPTRLDKVNRTFIPAIQRVGRR